jgi:hypothetical protein
VGMRNAMRRPDLFAGLILVYLFLVNNGVPGPGAYKETTKVAVKSNGKFLSSEERFCEKFVEVKPGPNEYLSGNYGKSMLRKTFNISLGLNERKRIKAMGY